MYYKDALSSMTEINISVALTQLTQSMSSVEINVLLLL